MTLFIGSGRLATHFKRYFHLVNLPYLEWNRKHHSQSDLQSKLAQTNRVWLMISDGSLADFLANELFDYEGLVLHSSGALELSGAIGMHPLMTFGPETYSLDFYQKIPFVTSVGHSLQSLYPELLNPSYPLPADKKGLYHALCVTSGNFTTLLWQESLRGFQELGLPPSVATPYLMQIMNNILADPNKALTGPIARKDSVTVTKNLSSLAGRSLRGIYLSFIENYFPEYKI